MFWTQYQLLCQSVGKSPNGVAKEIGLSSGTVTFWKNGKIPKSDTLKKIADYFGVTVDYLLGDDKKEKSDATEKTTFWNNIVTLCNEKGISPNGLCAQLGFSNATATKWKSGAIPRGNSLKKIADYFDVSTGYLLGNEPKEKALPSLAQSLNETETELVKAFRAAAPETQDAVLRVLQIDTGRTQRKDA